MSIPLLGHTDSYHLICNNCHKGISMTRKEFGKLKRSYKPMNKKTAKKCFDDICRMCDSLDTHSETNVDSVMEKISAEYPITANETLSKHYRELVAMRFKVNEQRKLRQLHEPEPEEDDEELYLPQVAATKAHIPQATAGSVGGKAWICSCGATNTTNFCADCGAKRSSSKPNEAENAKPDAVTSCPRCGTEDMSAPLFCSVCGKPMNASNHR